MVKIYAIKNIDVVFYIGKCIDIEKRKANHIRESMEMITEKDRLIQYIIKYKKDLDICILEECEDYLGHEREKYFIHYYFNLGHPLTNIVHITAFQPSKLQLQVLLLLSKDMDTLEISDILQKSPRTIETIRQQLKKKSRVKTLPGLIMWGIENRFITPNI